MNDFTKFVAAIKKWGWGRTSFLLALFLLVRQIVTFDQALILILLAVVLDVLVHRDALSPRNRTPGSTLTRKESPIHIREPRTTRSERSVP